MSNAISVKLNDTTELHIEPVEEHAVEIGIQTDGQSRPPMKKVEALIAKLYELAEDYAEESENPSAVGQRFGENLLNETLVLSTWNALA